MYKDKQIVNNVLLDVHLVPVLVHAQDVLLHGLCKMELALNVFHHVLIVLHQPLVLLVLPDGPFIKVNAKIAFMLQVNVDLKEKFKLFVKKPA